LKPLKIIFAGTPEFAAKHLEQLLATEHEVVAVYTKPDKPVGRGKKIHYSAVKSLAMKHHLPIEQPKSLRCETAQARLKAFEADVMVVVAYGLILPQEALDIPKFGCLNVHGSLLPRWRGAAPIQRALWAGDDETGVTIMQMDAGLDTGPMLHKIRCAIDASDTSATLYEKLAALGPKALLETLTLVYEQKLQPEVQDEALVTHAHKLSKEEARLDWFKVAKDLALEVKAFNPWPMSYFAYKNQLIKVRKVEVISYHGQEVAGTVVGRSSDGIDIVTGQGALRLQEMQLPSKAYQPAHSLLNAYSDWFNVGELLSCK
jgi:methionyl-tRNA formyltransferase